MNVALSDKSVIQEKQEDTGVHPQKFALWLAIASMTMFFAALTSALLVKKGDYQVWENFELPGIFKLSTATIVLLSVCIHASLISYRKAKFGLFRWLLFFSLLLGLAFLAMQVYGWEILKQMGFPLTGNIAGSFIYLITASHGVHIIGGLMVTLMFLFFAIRSRKDPIYELRDVINPKRQLRLEMLVTYWHFVDAVWVYLYIFFLLNYQ
ncbi:MAG: cytochrome c oxidase subunit 3 [Chitinophagales bacterium]